MKFLSAEVKELAHDFYGAIGTPFSMRLRKALIEGDWDYIASSKCDPRAYTSSQEYFLDASAASLLRKYKDLPVSSFDKVASAISNWNAGEVDCFRTNERLSPYLEGLSHPLCDTDVYSHVVNIRKKISDVLGACPRIEDLNPRHGPGATYSDKSVRSTIADKMNSRASLTGSAIWFLLDWVGTAWGKYSCSAGQDPVFVRGNRFATAPKDATKDRPIGAEPSVNVFYQLGLGHAVRRRLKRLGIDLDNGQTTHRVLAREASISGRYATLDLKNASDTVAYNLVKLLLPPRWFDLFASLRSPFTRFSSERPHTSQKRGSTDSNYWVKLEKFSSMGNGFTFELETLIFWAISDYACESTVSDHLKTFVYGDDIIVDSRSSEAVIALLRFFGFTLNLEKSFAEGAFRESCGGDFWDGRPVRPYFLKEPLDEPQRLIACINQIRRLGQDLYGNLGPFDRIWYNLQDRLPRRVRQCRGPNWLGDIVIHDIEDHYSWTSKDRTRVFAYIPVKHRKVSLRNFREDVVLACGLYGLDVSKGFINPRDSVIGHDVRRVPVIGIDWVPTRPIRPHWDLLPVSIGLPRPDYNRVRRVI